MLLFVFDVFIPMWLALKITTASLVCYRFEHVFKQAGVRNKFEIADYVKAIALMNKHFEGQELGKL